MKLSILVLAKDAKLPLLRPQLLLPVDVFGTFLALLLLTLLLILLLLLLLLT